MAGICKQGQRICAQAVDNFCNNKKSIQNYADQKRFAKTSRRMAMSANAMMMAMIVLVVMLIIVITLA